jgi:hypothetical protein
VCFAACFTDSIIPCKYQIDTVHLFEPHSYLIIPKQESFKYVDFTQKDKGVDNCGINVGFPGGATDFLLLQTILAGCGAHPALCPWVLDAVSLGLKQLACEAEHSPLQSVEPKIVWRYTSTPPYAFVESC